MIQQPLEEQQLPLCPFHDGFKSLNSPFDLGFCIKFAKAPSTSGAGKVICCASREDGVEVTTVVTTQPMRLIEGSITAPSFLVDVHLLSSFFLLLFSRVGFPDVCYHWAERGTKRNC